MRHGSLFSGIGGFDLAAEWMGWENVFHCEKNPFGQRVLKYYWPNSISYNDITETDFTIHRGKIDILTGGFPCQPYSLAGQRKGNEDDRHLWPEMLRAIREIKPKWIVGENVYGLVNWNDGLVFEEVQSQMEAEGYEIQPCLLPASSVQAPHKRDRIWFIANLDGAAKIRRSQTDESKSRKKGIQQQHNVQYSIKSDSVRNNSDTNEERFEGRENRRGFKKVRENENKQSNRFFRSSWKGFPNSPLIRNGNDGIPTELDGITVSKWCKQTVESGGNAIVPQVAFEIFKAIELFDLKYNNT